MTRTTADPRAWLAWVLAAGLLVSVTRNPVTLLTMLLVVMVVGARATPVDAWRTRWSLLTRLFLWLTAATVVFNLLVARAGSTPLAHLPADWPLVGGTLTVNALVHGLLTALGLGGLLAVWSIFNLAVGQGDLLRLIPRPLYLAGVVTAIALTFAPGLGRAAREIAEARALRGQPDRGARDWPPLAAPLLTTGLERGLSLAEAMEARGFGAQGNGRRTRYARWRWEAGDTIMLAGAALAITLVILARLSGDAAFDYQVYPHLTPPPVSGLALAAALALLGPVVAAERGWR